MTTTPTLDIQDLLQRYKDIHSMSPLFLEILLEELPLAEKKEPGFLKLLLTAERAGKISGVHHVQEEPYKPYKLTGCGCGYGQGTGLNKDRAMSLCDDIHTELNISERFDTFGTPLERLVLNCSPGDTPATKPELALLDEVLVYFLSSLQGNTVESVAE